MPFTISHAAAVLPLRRFTKGALPLAALMIGSMSPDFSYFLPGDLAFLPTHTLAGLFWFCWPAGLAAWLLFVHVLEAPTLALLPEPWRTRITPSDSRITLANIAFASVAVLIGAVTHVIWDSFTHRYSPVTDALPLLRISLFKIGWTHIYVYKFLQHLSSVVGMVALLIWARRIRHAPQVQMSGAASEPTCVTDRTRLAAAAVLLITSCSFAIANYVTHAGVYFERRLFHFAIGGMIGWMLAWLAIAAAIHICRNKCR
ncbi:MAG TPA: DUF4184 family protein [Steroidobacteraceae bacterium]|nr:DUF4184 family protein [Steroidobacteraceae bacterium]